MENIRVFYLENQKGDFTLIKEKLEERNMIVYPRNLAQWSDTLLTILTYLKANEEGRKALTPGVIEVFRSCNPDLFIFDYYLIGTEYNSTVIFNEILKMDSKLSNIPVIFLTIEDKEELFPVDQNTGFVLKEDDINNENVSITIELLIKEMEKFSELLKIDNGHKSEKQDTIKWLRKNF